MSATETSRSAYKFIFGELGNRQARVLTEIEDSPHGLTNSELCRVLRWPINCVTPRTKELRVAGLVAQSGERIDPETGRTCKVWVRVSGVQSELFQRCS